MPTRAGTVVRMAEQTSPPDVPVAPAATVMLLRDGHGGLEVFMLRRTSRAVFAGGMYVFPGGRLDHNDGQGDAAFVVAAIRECFEEAGVLLARGHDGTSVRDGHPVLSRRHDVHDGVATLSDLCATHELALSIDDLAYVGRWITPKGETARRFDTRFFAAPMPAGQSSHHDDSETVASEWIRPAVALQRNADGEMMLMPPTLSMLDFLAQHDTSAAAMRAAHQIGDPQTVLPKVRVDAEGKVVGIALPGDDDYDSLD